jgi:hypothetical protein
MTLFIWSPWPQMNRTHDARLTRPKAVNFSSLQELGGADATSFKSACLRVEGEREADRRTKGIKHEEQRQNILDTQSLDTKLRRGGGACCLWPHWLRGNSNETRR